MTWFLTLSLMLSFHLAFAQNTKLLPVETLFLNYKSPGLSPLTKVDSYEILAESEDAFLAKVEALLGYRPTLDLIKNMNPYVEFDLSRLPKLSRIYVSSLIFRKDFSGTVLARLLEIHAARGTEVFVMSTGYINSKNDILFLKEIASRQPRFHVYNFKYHMPSSERWLKKTVKKLNIVQAAKNYLKDFHIKVMITESETPENNIVITGGRNVHDGFLFSTKPSFPDYPELAQLKPRESYAYWQDFDIKFVSKSLVQHAIHQTEVFLKMSNLQSTSIFNEVALNTATKPQEVDSKSHIWTRQFVSMPYADSHALEKLYVDLIDSARTTIKISSPYLMPMPSIYAALRRAIDRQVKIQIQTRINLQGDTQAWLYEATNISAINSLYQQTEVYEWIKPSILHTKMMLIDDTVAVVGSVNLSHRSFVEDIEGITLIYNHEIVQKLVSLQDQYHNVSQLITKKQKVKLIPNFIVHQFADEF